jgi:hypothetical protein
MKINYIPQLYDEVTEEYNSDEYIYLYILRYRGI